MTDQDVRDFLERMAAEEPTPFFDAEPLTRRARRRAARTVVVGAVAIAAAIAVVLGGVGAIRSAPIPLDHPTPTPAPSRDLGIFAPVAGRIVYGNKLGIWGVDPTGPADPSATVQLTSEAGDPQGWSSDGTRLLIVRDELLFILHADGTETQVTTAPMDIGGATISPDGSRVVFAGKPEDEPSAVYAVDSDGGRAEMLVESQHGVVRTPTFSPDGTRIAYVDDNTDVDHSVWVMDADGSDAHQIVPDQGAGFVDGLAWSPVGDRIALGFNDTIYTFAPDGSDFTPVLTGGYSPSWSSDGSRFAYTIACPGADGCGLGFADADGSNAREFGFATSGPWHPAPVTADDTTPPEPRKDREVLVFARMGTGSGLDIATQDPETGEVRKIVETEGIVDCPNRSQCVNFIRRAEWSSDGRWVAFEVSSAGPDGPCTPSDGVWVQGPVGDPWQLTKPCLATPGAKGIQELWAWSPDGARLAYARVDVEDYRLFVIDPTDGSRTLRVQNGPNPTALEWAPDGTRIAFAAEGDILEVTAEPETGAGLWVLRRDSFEDVIDIDYSPDGAQIMVQDQGRYRIQVMNADGSDLHVLLEGKDACCQTAWSPNGDRILYQLSIENGTGPFDSEVWTIAPDGSDPIKVFDSYGCDMGAIDDALPVWAPNGTQVAYNACGQWVVSNADGTGEPQPIDELVYRSWAGGGLSG